ncbi:MAG: phosphotransacetylase family protein [Candidatus Bathyarchaeia archaeon]
MGGEAGGKSSERWLMSRIIYVTSNRGGEGKTTLSLAIALKALSSGLRAGYFKPVAISKTAFGGADPDTAVMEGLLNMSRENSSPILSVSPQDLLDVDRIRVEEAVSRIRERIERLIELYEILILEGVEGLSFGASIGVSAPALSSIINAKLFLMARPESDQVIDEIITLNHYCRGFNSRVEAVVFNRVPELKIERVNAKYREILMDNGIRVLGVVPERSELLAPTVRDLNRTLKGEVLAGEAGMDRLAENILIGAMGIENAAKFIRRSHNSIVITGGDRTDLALTALEAQVSGIILTGGIYPSIKILPKADELSIPIILVPYDTYTTLQIVHEIRGRILPSDDQRMETLKKLYWENVNLGEMLET